MYRIATVARTQPHTHANVVYMRWSIVVVCLTLARASSVFAIARWTRCVPAATVSSAHIPPLPLPSSPLAVSLPSLFTSVTRTQALHLGRPPGGSGRQCLQTVQ